ETRTIAGATHPVLAEVPGEARLLAYARTDQAGAINATLVVQRLDDWGASEWELQVAQAVVADEIAAACPEPGFVVAGRNVEAGQQLIPIGPKGQLGAEVELGELTNVGLARGGADRVATVWQDEQGYHFAWRDGAAEPIGQALLLAPPDEI